MYNTGERSEPEKIIIIRLKQPLDPLSVSIKHPHKSSPHLRQISGGGGGGVRTPGPPSGSAHDPIVECPV